MKKARGWARAKPAGAHLMRLGAWYPIVDERNPTMVVLGIARRNVPVPRDLVGITREAPQQFSVVHRSLDDPNPARGTPDDVGLTYAVCPSSGTRVPLTGQPEHLECPSCGELHPVDWEAAHFSTWHFALSRSSSVSATERSTARLPAR